MITRSFKSLTVLARGLDTLANGADGSGGKTIAGSERPLLGRSLTAADLRSTGDGANAAAAALVDGITSSVLASGLRVVANGASRAIRKAVAGKKRSLGLSLAGANLRSAWNGTDPAAAALIYRVAGTVDTLGLGVATDRAGGAIGKTVAGKERPLGLGLTSANFGSAGNCADAAAAALVHCVASACSPAKSVSSFARQGGGLGTHRQHTLLSWCC